MLLYAHDNNIGVVDSSGMEFFYSSQPPLHEAGILAMGHLVTNFMIIPPGIKRFGIIGRCGGECTHVSC